MRPQSGEMEETDEICTRLRAVTPGCEVRHYNPRGRGWGKGGGGGDRHYLDIRVLHQA